MENRTDLIAARKLVRSAKKLVRKVLASEGLELCKCEIFGCSGIVILAVDDRSQPVCAGCVESLAECAGEH